ncbi:MAG: nucleotidyltransferase domain-containing protein [Defluviitaleaceae bacterium]|nr:nucleotidyltransferase domain-containing protein [Defluviitaleaceae bacterium]
MKKWEQAARKFIEICNFRDDIETVFLTGSHAFGNADEFSDIDLYIVLSDSVDYRERGNKRIDGFNIEYFANPMRQIERYIESGYPNANLIEINMMLGGIVIYDRNGGAKKAMFYCREKLKLEIPEMSNFNIKTGLYHFWDSFDELQRVYLKQAPDFVMQFFCFVQNAFELYSRYTCSPVPSYHKMHRWLTDDEYRSKYGLAEYNDPVFLEIIKATFECDDRCKMFELSKNVYEYVSEKMGGFDIDNFVLRGSCE